MEYRLPKVLKSEEASYLAGLIDGEGTVTLTKRNRGKERTVVVSIANTEMSLLEYPMEIVGVGKITSKRRSKTIHSPSWTYQVSGRQAIELLRQIIPS